MASEGGGPPGLRKLAWATAVGLFLVILMGSVVTDTGSGRGCGGTWPLCNGKFVPALALHSLIEFSHRAVAAVVGLMAAALLIWVWRRLRAPAARALAAVCGAFVLIQALLGGADVMWPESAPVLALHYGFALIAFGAATLLALWLGGRLGGAATSAPGFRNLAWVCLLYIYGLVYLGAYVAHSGAGLACGGWPLCEGSLIPPDLHGAVLVAFGHRLAALGAMVLLGWLAAAAGRLRPSRPRLRGGARLAFGLVLAQALSGAWLVGSGISTSSLVLHGTLVAALFAAVAYVAVQALPRRSAAGALPGGVGRRSA